MYRWTVLGACMALTVQAMAAVADTQNLAKQKDAKTLSAVQVTAIPPPLIKFDAASHWGQGFLSAPTGNGFVGHAYLTASTTPSSVPANNTNPCDKVGDPILPATGTKTLVYPLFELPGEMGLRYVLYYNSSTKGLHWTDNLSYHLDTNCLSSTQDGGVCLVTTLYRPDGSSIVFNGGPKDTVYTGGGVATLTRDPASGNYTLRDEDSTTQTYSASGALLAIKNASGVGWTLATKGTTTTVTHTSGRSFSLTYSGTSGQTTATVTDPGGNVYTIVGANSQTLSSISYPGTPATTISFKYQEFTAPPVSPLVNEIDYNGRPYAYTTYDTSPTISGSFANVHYRWATGESLADGSERNTISYYADNQGHQSATITNPLGFQSTKTYDAKGNVTLVSNNAVQTCGATVSGRTYDNYYHLTAEIDNNGNTHTYTYAANGQLQTETEAYGTPLARTTDYVWDPDVRLNRLLRVTVRGWQQTAYTYDADNRLASESVTDLSGQGNQTLTTSYSYHYKYIYFCCVNGQQVVSSKTLDEMIVSHPSLTYGGNMDRYVYDGQGNLVSVSIGYMQLNAKTTTYSNYNGLGQPGHVVGPNGDVTDYTYDARGRVATKTTYSDGTAATWTYTYDGFGLLSRVDNPFQDQQTTTWTRDPSTMRMTTITHNDKEGTSTESFSYDANGDVLEHKIARGDTVSLDELFHYDALGRVYQKVGQHGQVEVYAYDGNGNTLSVTNALGHTISYQYDALNRVIATSETGGASAVAIPSAAPTLNAPSSSPNGSYAVSWNSITGATSYVLQMAVNGGGWSTVQNSADISWSASNQPSGSYGYQVQACNVSGCSPWSGTATTTVVNVDPALNAIGINGQAYRAAITLRSGGGGGVGIGFDIANGTTWEVYKVTSANVRTVLASGALPSGASTVQYTWGPSSALDGADAGGSIVNGASSPVSVSSNPATEYFTDGFSYNQGDHGRQYAFRVDFYDVTGTLISTSTCTLSAEVLSAI